WSDELIQRPLTMPKGKTGIYAELAFDHFSSDAGSETTELLGAGVAYGIDDKLEIGASYAIALHEFEGKGPLTLYGDYSLYNKGPLTVAVNVDLLIDFLGSVDVNLATGETSSSTDLALEAGLGVRYRINDKIALFTGNPIAPEAVGKHLHIGLNHSGPVSFDIPVGIGVQPTPQFYASAATNIAHLGFSNDSNAVIFSDFFDLELRAFYVVNKNVDVGAFLTLPDLVNAQFDVVEFGIGAAYYAL
ncbi:MAG TPA: hypothetical protein VGC41_29760, partial [Kofleriaceae bacterium]